MSQWEVGGGKYDRMKDDRILPLDVDDYYAQTMQ